MNSGQFLTRRGRRVACTVGAGLTWGAVVALLIVACVTGSNDVGRVGLALSAVAAAWTICLTITRHSELVVAAYVSGREEGRAEVATLHGPR